MKIKPAFTRGRICALIAAALLCAAVSSCKSKPMSSTDGAQGNNIPGAVQIAAGSDDEGVRITLESYDFSDGEQALTVVWENQTHRTVMFGDPFALEKQKGERWERITDRDIVFNAIGYGVAPSDCARHIYPISSVYGALEAGVYRLTAEFFFEEDIPIEADDRRRVWIDFTVGSPLTGTYEFSRSLYVNPLSSFMPVKGHMPSYLIGANSLYISHQEGKTYSAGSLVAAPFDREDFYDSFGEFDISSAPKPEIRENALCFAYDVVSISQSPQYRIYCIDKEIWLAQLYDGIIWQLYALEKTSAEILLPENVSDTPIPVDTSNLVDITTDEILQNTQYKIFWDPATFSTFAETEGVCFALGTGFGGFGVADLTLFDAGERQFFLFTYSFGSGLHRSHIGVFDLNHHSTVFTSPAYINNDMVLEEAGDAEFIVRHAELDLDGVPPFLSSHIGERIGLLKYKNGAWSFQPEAEGMFATQ